MVSELMVAGGASGIVALGCFGGAVRETFKLQSLRQLWDATVEEPVPANIINTLNSLGGEENGVRSKQA
jgi:hypothetical protein